MATQAQKTNGSGAMQLDLGMVRERAGRVTDSANGIARIAATV